MTRDSVQALFDVYGAKLGLDWLGGRQFAHRPLLTESTEQQASLVGHLNFIRPHRILIAGVTELAYLESLDDLVLEEALEGIEASHTAVLIIADGMVPPPQLLEHAERHGIAVLASALSGATLLDHLKHYLAELVGEVVTIHGVFMEVAGIGVLITGESSIGKSELALELVNRGQRLIADDAPQFRLSAPNTITGTAPSTLKDFLEVRGLGILNIRAMFGDGAVKRQKNLKLVIHLQMMDEASIRALDRLHGSRHSRTILGVDVPEVVIPVAPARNLAVLVEAAARNQILQDNGYDAADDLIARQAREMKK